jgi:hypothetical protein
MRGSAYKTQAVVDDVPGELMMTGRKQGALASVACSLELP